MRDVPWEDVFKLCASAAAGEFWEWVQKISGQASLISMVSAAFAAVIVHRNRFLDSRPQSERSYKVGSVRLSFHLSIGFLRIGSLVFSENYHGVRGPYIVVCDSQIFWTKSPLGKID